MVLLEDLDDDVRAAAVLEEDARVWLKYASEY